MLRRRVIWAVLAGLWVLLPGLHPARGQVAVGLETSAEETILPDGGVAVTMHRYRKVPMVDATINGKGPYRLLVDTGAPGMIINKSLAEKLELPGSRRFGGAGVGIHVGGPGGEGLPASMHQIDSLKVGEAEFRGLETLAIDTELGSEFDGVLGIGVLRECLLTFDYPAGKLRLTKEELPASNGRDVLDYEQRMGLSAPRIAVEVNGKPIHLVLDTGATGWFMFRDDLTELLSYEYGPVKGPQAATVDREIDTQVARLEGKLKLGHYVFDRPCAVVGEEAIPSLIGNRALENFVFSLDQKNKRLRLARDSTEPIPPSPFRILGLGLRKADNGHRIWHVLAGSPAEKAGLKTGDLVVGLAGQPGEQVYGRPIWYELLEGESIQVRCMPSGSTEVREVEVEVLELVP